MQPPEKRQNHQKQPQKQSQQPPLSFCMNSNRNNVGPPNWNHGAVSAVNNDANVTGT